VRFLRLFHDICADRIRGSSRLTEEEMWTVFHCLARAACTLERGTEDMDLKRWDEKQIVHFDLKQNNSK